MKAKSAHNNKILLVFYSKHLLFYSLLFQAYTVARISLTLVSFSTIKIL